MIIIILIGFILSLGVGIIIILTFIPSILFMTVLLIFKKNLEFELSFKVLWSGILIYIPILLIQAILLLLFFGILL